MPNLPKRNPKRNPESRGTFFARFLLAIAAASAPALSKPGAPDARALARKAAEFCGAPAFANLDTLHFTFNVEIGDTVRSRKWSWLVALDSVVYAGRLGDGLDTVLGFARGKPEDSLQRQADQWFVNDSYWLLFPCHLAWDKGLKFSAEAVRDSALGGDLFRLTVVYPPGVGYTPGDAYDLFLDAQGVVHGWIYRKANGSQGRATRWSGPEKAGPLRLSLYRKGLQGRFNVWFTDVRAVSRKPAAKKN